MADFFASTTKEEPGLALFLNAGDPALEVLPDVAAALDESGVDVLELAVPFPDSCTDGPVIRASADRALHRGTDLSTTLAAVAGFRHRLRGLRVVLLADWSHTVRAGGVPNFLSNTIAHGVDAVLVHGLPPRMRAHYLDAAAHIGMPVVTTCYANSTPTVLAEAARSATAYVYLVAHYGRSGPAGTADFAALRDPVTRLRAGTHGRIAVGFGVRSRHDLREIHLAGADAAVVGSVAVARVAAVGDHNVADELATLVHDIRPASAPTPTYPAERGTRP